MKMPSSLHPHHHHSTKDLEMNKTITENANLNFFFVSEEQKLNSLLKCSWKRIGFKCANLHFGFCILMQCKLTWELEVSRGSFSTGDFLNDHKNACTLITKGFSNSVFLWSSINISLSSPASYIPLLLEEVWDPRGSAQRSLEIGFFCGVTEKEFQKDMHRGILSHSGKFY